MAARRKNGDQLKPAPFSTTQATPKPLIWFLPRPYPPIHVWILKHCKRVPPRDFARLIHELNILGILMFFERRENKWKIQSRITPQESELVQRHKQVIAAVNIIADNLPSLIGAARAELSRPFLGFKYDTESARRATKSMQEAVAESANAIKIEERLLEICLQVKNLDGFYGAAEEAVRPKFWASDARLLFFWLSWAFERAGVKPPKQRTVSAKAPFVKIIQEALLWAGYGHKELEAIAQTLKRDSRPKIPKKFSSNLYRVAITENALMSTMPK